MKANNLTISIPGGCKKNCPYCVSNMTFAVKDDPELFKKNLSKVYHLANRIGVSHVLITGKGEPFENTEYLGEVLDMFENFPIEVQTSYHKFTNTERLLFSNINVLAVSIDSLEQLKDPIYWRQGTNLSFTFNLIYRLTIILTKSFLDYGLEKIVEICKNNGIRQLTIRQPTIPVKIRVTRTAANTAKWIKENTIENHYAIIMQDLDLLIKRGKAAFIRDLHFGAKVYDIMGVSFTAMEYCVESQNGETMRSLIYQGDGHLYTTWDHPGSIIF